MRILVIAADAYAAASVLGTVAQAEARARAECILLGRGLDAADPELARLPFARVALAEGVPADADVDEIGARLLPHLTGLDATVLLDSSQDSRDLAGWLAARLDATLVWAVESLTCGADACVRAHQAAEGGEALLVHRLPAVGPSLVLTRPRALEASEAAGATPAIELLAVDPVAERLEGTVAEGGGASRHDLQAARVVIGVGRGIGDPEHLPLFRELAAALGGELGATRAVVDRGWLPFSHQIGQTGVTVAPDVYIGFGVSGAVQHRVGIRDSGRIVAVNTDRDAPLCAIADVVIEADAVDAARAFLANLATRSGGN